jgi:hypothetical protein
MNTGFGGVQEMRLITYLSEGRHPQRRLYENLPIGRQAPASASLREPTYRKAGTCIGGTLLYYILAM